MARQVCKNMRPKYPKTKRVTFEDLKRIPKGCRKAAIPTGMDEILCSREWLESRRHPVVPVMLEIEVQTERGEHWRVTFDDRTKSGMIRRFMKAAGAQRTRAPGTRKKRE